MAKHRAVIMALLLLQVLPLTASAQGGYEELHIRVDFIQVEYDTPTPIWGPASINVTETINVIQRVYSLRMFSLDVNGSRLNVTKEPIIIFSAPETITTNIAELNVSICAVYYGDGPAANVNITAVPNWTSPVNLTTSDDGCAYLHVVLPNPGAYSIEWLYKGEVVATTTIVYSAETHPPSNVTQTVTVAPGLPVVTPVTPNIGVPVSVPALAFIALGLAALVVAVMQGGADLGEAILIASVPYGIAVILLGFKEAGLTMVAAGILAYIFLRR